MEINLRNVPFSEELLFFIRRCAGDAGALGGPSHGTLDLEVRLSRIDVPYRVHEVTIVRREAEEDQIVLETDPDVYLAVRNAFDVLRARDGRSAERRRAAQLVRDGSADYGS